MTILSCLPWQAWSKHSHKCVVPNQFLLKFSIQSESPIINGQIGHKSLFEQVDPTFYRGFVEGVSIEATASVLRGYTLQPHLIILPLWNLNFWTSNKGIPMVPFQKCCWQLEFGLAWRFIRFRRRLDSLVVQQSWRLRKNSSSWKRKTILWFEILASSRFEKRKILLEYCAISCSVPLPIGNKIVW